MTIQALLFGTTFMLAALPACLLWLIFGATPQRMLRTPKAAKHGPVFITNRGQPSHVLLSIEDYQKLAGHQASIIELLAMPDADSVDFEPPRLSGNLYRPDDFS